MSDQPTNGTQKPEHSSPMKFPCDFVIKAMGKNDDAFRQTFTQIVVQHFPNSRDQIAERLSKDNTYLALSVKVLAESKEQLDQLYQALTDAPEILMAL